MLNLISTDSLATAGSQYKITYKVDNLLGIDTGYIISEILKLSKGLINKTNKYYSDKEFIITNVIDKDQKIEIYVKVISNPAPLVAIVYAVVALLGIFGAWLILDKVEQVLENPVIATGTGLLLILAAIYIYLTFIKGKF